MMLPNLAGLSIGGADNSHTLAAIDKGVSSHQLDLISNAADVYLDNKYKQSPQNTGDEIRAFQSATLLISYACERILTAKRFETVPLAANVKQALSHILSNAASVVANTTSARWFRKDESDPAAILYWLNQAVMMQSLDDEDSEEIISKHRKKYNGRCQACGKESLKEAFVVEMSGWDSPDYDKFAPAPTPWNVDGLLDRPKEYELAFTRLYNSYTGDPKLRPQPWAKKFVVGPTCHALCVNRHIARTFFVESMFATTGNLMSFKASAKGVKLKAPEFLTAYTWKEDGHDLTQQLPNIMLTIRNAMLKGTNSTSIREMERETDPLFDEDVHNALRDAMKRKRKRIEAVFPLEFLFT